MSVPRNRITFRPKLNCVSSGDQAIYPFSKVETASHGATSLRRTLAMTGKLILELYLKCNIICQSMDMSTGNSIP